MASRKYWGFAMRDLINKLTLLESSGNNISKIARFFTLVSSDGYAAIVLPIVIQLPYPYLGVKRKMAFNLSYQVNKNTGMLEKMPVVHHLTYTFEEQRELEKIWKDEPDDEEHYLANKLATLIYNDLKSNNSKIKAETKNVLLNMGFSNDAANFFIAQIELIDIGDVGVEVRLPSASEMRRFQSENAFHIEVNDAYQWRQEHIGDL
jgi:hypothetical protein